MRPHVRSQDSTFRRVVARRAGRGSIRFLKVFAGMLSHADSSAVASCAKIHGSYVNPTPLAHADTSRDVLPRGGTSQLLYIIVISCRQQNVFAALSQLNGRPVGVLACKFQLSLPMNSSQHRCIYEASVSETQTQQGSLNSSYGDTVGKYLVHLGDQLLNGITSIRLNTSL
ncbi:hypothetical protein TNCV_640361 [Trichonephila clavipes]|nr:hypothetical protein TNCV_640361 [Trichonephila clavipes]